MKTLFPFFPQLTIDRLLPVPLVARCKGGWDSAKLVDMTRSVVGLLGLSTSGAGVSHSKCIVFSGQPRLGSVAVVAPACARLVSRSNVGIRVTVRSSTSGLAAGRICGVEV
jgi:hypothetical protein